MKILALVGTNANFSYNRILLKYMKKHFRQMADIEIAEISQLPAFSVETPVVPCLLYTSPSPRDRTRSRMPSSA